MIHKKYRLGTVNKNILEEGLNGFHCAPTSHGSRHIGVWFAWTTPSFAFLYNFMLAGRTLYPMTVPAKNVSIDEMVGA